jgi:hypothetical protein
VEETKKKKQFDPLTSLKYKGYCWSQTPPGDETTFEDFATFAKFFLCRHARRLWKDPIWDSYTNEEIMIEYFAHLFAKDEAARKEFEVQIDAGTALYGEDIFDWLDRKVRENWEENKKKFEEMPDKVTFSPETGKDIEE